MARQPLRGWAVTYTSRGTVGLFKLGGGNQRWGGLN